MKSTLKEDLAQITLSFSRKMKYDYVSSFAGHAALFILMSFFPMMMYIVSMLSYLPISENYLIDHYIGNLLPSSVISLIEELLKEAYIESTTTLKSFTIIGTLVCAARGVYAIIIGLNAVYGIRESRNYFILYFFAVIYVLAFFCMFGLVMVLIVFGNYIFEFLIRFIPNLINIQNAFYIGKYIFMLILLFAFYLVIYLHIPNRKSKIRYEFIGALFSSAAIIVFSLVFSFYVDSFANYSITYGSLTSMIVFILWLYGIMYITFIGAEINGVLRKSAEYKYDYKRTYDYYMNEYQGELFNDKDLEIIKKATNRVKKLEKKGEK